MFLSDYETDSEDLIMHYKAIDFDPSTRWFESSPVPLLLIFIVFLSSLGSVNELQFTWLTIKTLQLPQKEEMQDGRLQVWV